MFYLPYWNGKKNQQIFPLAFLTSQHYARCRRGWDTHAAFRRSPSAQCREAPLSILRISRLSSHILSTHARGMMPEDAKQFLRIHNCTQNAFCLQRPGEHVVRGYEKWEPSEGFWRAGRRGCAAPSRWRCGWEERKQQEGAKVLNHRVRTRLVYRPATCLQPRALLRTQNTFLAQAPGLALSVPRGEGGRARGSSPL